MNVQCSTEQFADGGDNLRIFKIPHRRIGVYMSDLIEIAEQLTQSPLGIFLPELPDVFADDRNTFERSFTRNYPSSEFVMFRFRHVQSINPSKEKTIR